MDRSILNKIERARQKRILETPMQIYPKQSRIAGAFGGGAGGGSTYIARIDGNANAGGYYDAYLQTFDSSDWKTTTSPLGDDGDAVEIWNMAEAGHTTTNFLAEDDIVSAWEFTDDEDNIRYVCNEQWIRLAKTQEAAQGDEFLSIKLVDRSGSVTGSAFDCKFYPDTTPPDLNVCRPRIASGDFVWVTKWWTGGVWFIVSPYFHSVDSVVVVAQVDTTDTTLWEKHRTVEVFDDGDLSVQTNIDVGTSCE